MELRAYPYDVCDFCSSDKPTWDYPAEDCIISPAGDPTPQHSIGGWLACDECAALIQRNEWTKLARRSLSLVSTAREAVAVMGEEAALASITQGHRIFRANRSGKVQPYEADNSR
jgi:hypothetical protein